MTKESNEQLQERPVALTIAGSDSGGGAGLQADLKTFAAKGVHGTSVITLITAQNTLAVDDIQVLGEDIVKAQFKAIAEDFDVRAAKTGALGNGHMIETICECIDQYELGPLVVDPVMVSKHGDSLLPARAHNLIVEELVPRADLITPNRYEAQIIAGKDLTTPDTLKDAARQIFDETGTEVVIKGGHLEDRARDFYCNGKQVAELSSPRVDTQHLHGSGCVHSSIITAELAKGESKMDAVRKSRRFITDAIQSEQIVGKGICPVNPMFDVWD